MSAQEKCTKATGLNRVTVGGPSHPRAVTCYGEGMTTPLSFRYAGAVAAVAMLFGCGIGPQTAPSGTTPNAARTAASWMDPAAAKGPLLYVSDYSNGSVYVYTYPQGKLAGTLSGFENPAGECADAKGNVWISEQTGADLVEYAHGGKKPIAKLSDPDQAPLACAVDSVTGNLAVTHFESLSGGLGSISIFARAKGTPVLYTDGNLPQMFDPAYDKHGNLFVTGEDSSVFKWAELRRGATALTDIALNVNELCTGVQSGGKDMVIQSADGKTIRRVSGHKIVGTTKLSGITAGVAEFTLDGSTLISAQPGTISLYKFPTGGKPTKTIKATFTQPDGTALSK
jgi:hypothetical protein